MSPAENVQAPAEPVDSLLGTCATEDAAAYVDLLVASALVAWRAKPRDTRGALGMLAQAMALIARREDFL